MKTEKINLKPRENMTLYTSMKLCFSWRSIENYFFLICLLLVSVKFDSSGKFYTQFPVMLFSVKVHPKMYLLNIINSTIVVESIVLNLLSAIYSFQYCFKLIFENEVSFTG